MKRSLVFLAVAGLATSAMAQSSVTLFGIVDAGVGYVKADGGGHATGLINGGSSTSRLGFRGTEDLGGGLAASFWLEGALNNDVGSGATQTAGFDFARRSTVSLSGSFGEIRVGRDFAASYTPLLNYDVFGQRGLGQIELPGVAANGVTGLNGIVRANNSVAYFLPATLGGFYGSLQYAFGERLSTTAPITTGTTGISTSAANATTDKTGNYIGGRFGYSKGPLDLSVSYGVYGDAVRAVGTSFYADDYKVGTVGGSYDFGLLKAVFFVQSEKIDGRGTIASSQLNTYSVGATAPLGAGLLRAQVSRYDLKDSSADANKFAIGYVYNLSKRTALYADVSRIANSGSSTSGGNYTFGGLGGSLTAAAPTRGGNANAFAVGVKHAF